MAVFPGYSNTFSSNFSNFSPSNLQNNPNMNAQFYLQDLQGMKDRIDRQMQQIQMQQTQQQNIPQQVPQVNQTFQLAPNKTSDIDVKVVKDIDEVKSIFVAKLGVFVNEDYSKLWIKNDYGNVREFNTTEIIEIDEKDRTIIEMRQEIERLKGELERNDESTDKSTVNDTNSTTTTTSKKSASVSKNK